jgi:hypothetical protein
VGPRSRSRHGGEEKDSQPLPGLEPPIIQPIAQRCTTELSRLLPSLISSCYYLWFIISEVYRFSFKNTNQRKRSGRGGACQRVSAAFYCDSGGFRLLTVKKRE